MFFNFLERYTHPPSKIFKNLFLYFLQPVTSGQYYGRKLTLKVGQLSFITVVTSAHWNKGVPVLLKPVDISFDLEPTLGGGYI